MRVPVRSEVYTCLVRPARRVLCRTECEHWRRKREGERENTAKPQSRRSLLRVWFATRQRTRSTGYFIFLPSFFLFYFLFLFFLPPLIFSPAHDFLGFVICYLGCFCFFLSFSVCTVYIQSLFPSPVCSSLSDILILLHSIPPFFSFSLTLSPCVCRVYSLLMGKRAMAIAVCYYWTGETGKKVLAVVGVVGVFEPDSRTVRTS